MSRIKSVPSRKQEECKPIPMRFADDCNFLLPIDELSPSNVHFYIIGANNKAVNCFSMDNTQHKAVHSKPDDKYPPRYCRMI